MEISDDQTSFDSSVVLESLSLTERTLSLDPNEKQFEENSFTQQPDEKNKIEESQSKEIARMADVQFTKSEFAFVADDFSVGFSNGWGKHKIAISNSKMLKVQELFDETPSDKPTLEDWFDRIDPAEGWPELLMPCFKTVGKGLTVTVTAQNKLKSLTLLGSSAGKSLQKSTKIKRLGLAKGESIVKTHLDRAKPNTIMKAEASKARKTLKLCEFDWSQYEMSWKNIAQGQTERRLQHKDSRQKTIIRKSPSANGIQFLKLEDLPSIQRASELAHELELRSADLLSFSCQHSESACTVVLCILCHTKFRDGLVRVNEVYELLTHKVAQRQLSEDVYRSLYSEVSFKLCRYQLYWPQVVNKQLNPSNLVVQLNKKIIATQEGNPASYLKYTITSGLIGKPLCVLVKRKYHMDKIDVYFLHLSDGWSSVWAVIQKQNLLHSYCALPDKIYVGRKIMLCLWKLYPIANILDYCPFAAGSQYCIQFFYNGSLLMPASSRLGKAKERFYRPLTRCRDKGGYIPVARGIVVRMFSRKEKLRVRQGPAFQIYFLQILTEEGVTCLIRFILGEESSLVEYFRLYHKYQFYKLKIDGKSLSFLMSTSKFEEVAMKEPKQHVASKSAQQVQYPEEVSALLAKRLVTHKKILLNALCKHSLYDFECEQGLLKDSDSSTKSIRIEICASESVNTKDYGLYQQYELLTWTHDSLTFQQLVNSSIARRLPKIYFDIPDFRQL